MEIHVVSAEFENEQWRAVKAFTDEEVADGYAYQIYAQGCWNNERVFDSRIDKVNLI